jgi:pyruvate/2-oxoglutarate dehydrogenase complex dihydrolipoamide dehydrogenase (E3) component
VVGGSCPNVNCLPSKNEIWNAKVANLVRHAIRFGITLGSASSDIAAVRKRKREMVEGLIAMNLDRYKESGNNYPVTTPNSIQRGNYSGVARLDVTITTPREKR